MQFLSVIFVGGPALVLVLVIALLVIAKRIEREDPWEPTKGQADPE